MRVNGYAVKAWRLERGLTVSALAIAVETPQPHLSRVEHGEREVSYALLERLARVLGVDVRALIGPDDEEIKLEDLAQAWPWKRGGTRKTVVGAANGGAK